jgi:hypothetical protein
LNKITHPYLYEINTWPWLEAISRKERTAVDLGSVPDRYWDEIADLGFDGVWLMGVWQRSPAGVAIALSNDELCASFAAAVPDWRPATLWDLHTVCADMLLMIISVDRMVSPAPARR